MLGVIAAAMMIIVGILVGYLSATKVIPPIWFLAAFPTAPIAAGIVHGLIARGPASWKEMKSKLDSFGNYKVIVIPHFRNSAYQAQFVDVNRDSLAVLSKR